MKLRLTGLALALPLLAACNPPPPPASGPRAALVRTVTVGAGAPTVYAGEIRARHEADLAFRIGGRMVERRAEVGATVQAGQVLARLDPADVALAADAAEAQRAAARADLALARAEYQRAEELRGRNFISASALDARRTALSAAEARLRQADAQAASARNQSGYADLRAPADGVVTAVLAEAGQVLASGQPVLRIATRGEREVLIHVPENLVARLAPGTDALAWTWADEQRRLPARVREIAPAADPATRTHAVRLSLGDATPPLGATASAAFAGPGAVALLPTRAVTRLDGRTQAWVLDADNRAHAMPVETGRYREEGVEILSGLPDGARVVVAGVHRLVEGETLRPVAEQAPVALDARR